MRVTVRVSETITFSLSLSLSPLSLSLSLSLSLRLPNPTKNGAHIKTPQSSHTQPRSVRLGGYCYKVALQKQEVRLMNALLLQTHTPYLHPRPATFAKTGSMFYKCFITSNTPMLLIFTPDLQPKRKANAEAGKCEASPETQTCQSA